uniref:Threonylcarbamoyladenosine tRNA methylthiotransferase n=1 Tax=Anas platyrhynchos platyrhynchos TaxID=8840 RepID=A0A493T0U1_ANAPP
MLYLFFFFFFFFFSPGLSSKGISVVLKKMPAACDSVLEDIEDIVSAQDPKPHDRQFVRKNVFPKVRKRSSQQNTQTDDDPPSDSIIPGVQKIWIRTWGCSHNNSDGEYMAGQLAAYGYKITDNSAEADLWLLNSCTVKNPAEDHFRNSIKKAQEGNKKVVLAGCVPQAQPRQDYLKGLSIIGVQQIDRVVEVVEETIKGHSVRLLGQKKDNGKRLGGARLDLPKIRKNPLIEIISINTGCLNACTYCKTKHARGDLASYPIEELVDRAKQSFQEGVCEIWLTSEDTGAYGRDIGTDLPTLLWKLVEVIPEGAMLRLGMTNPPYILEHLEEMAKILNHPRVYAFLHIPVQSASDSVLMDMKREYCVADFKRVVDFLKEKVPGITIATDIICGFPGETDEDFQETMKLVEQYRFPSLFINQFYPRPGTPAAKMHQVPAAVKKQRTKDLSQLFHSYNPYDHKVGERQRVLVTEESFDSNYYVAHNPFYEQVLVPKDPVLMGKMVEVNIYEAGKHFMKGQPVSDARVYTASITRPLAKGEVSGLTEIFRQTKEDSLEQHPTYHSSFNRAVDALDITDRNIPCAVHSQTVAAVLVLDLMWLPSSPRTFLNTASSSDSGDVCMLSAFPLQTPSRQMWWWVRGL